MSEIGLPLDELDTPCLVIDLDRLEANLERVAGYAAQRGLRYRPHTKTHKMPPVAHRQLRAGAKGITVAKLGEAEVMAAAGIDDIFIAHVIVGDIKLRRLAALAREVRVAVGVDHPEQARRLSEVFRREARPLAVRIEIDTGQGRAGVSPGEAAVELARFVHQLDGLYVEGIYTHEGHDYEATSLDELARIAREAQARMVATGRAVAAALGSPCLVSIGSTPSLASGVLLDGIDELRAGTCVFYDASQARLLGHYDWCAATVLATIVGTPAPDRAVADAGAKALSSDRRTRGLLATPGYGT
ncbi:MAG TPA: alanine racemase, partial [Bacillota bacterium]